MTSRHTSVYLNLDYSQDLLLIIASGHFAYRPEKLVFLTASGLKSWLSESEIGLTTLPLRSKFIF